MPDKVIDIPNVGSVAFPDTMTPEAINAAAAKLYADSNPNHPKPDPGHSWIDTAVDWLPTVGGAVGGVIGGIGGTVAGMGVGGVPGAIGGAAVGGAGGEGFKQAINALRGKPLPTAGQQATDIGLEAVKQGGAEAVGGALGAVAKPAAEALMQSALKPGLRVALSAARKGETPAVVKTLLNEGVNVTARGIEKLNAIIHASNEEIGQAIRGIPFEINPFKVTSRLRGTAREFANQVNPASDLDAISRVGQEFLENNTGMIQGTKAQSLKTGTYKQLAGKYGELKGAEVEAQKALARGLKDEIESEVGQTLPGLKGKLGLPGGVNIGAANAREGAAIAAREAVARRVAVGGNHNPMGLGALAVSHPVTFLTFLMDRSPAVKSMLARGLYSQAGHLARVSPQVIRAAVQAVATSEDATTPEGPTE